MTKTICAEIHHKGINIIVEQDVEFSVTVNDAYRGRRDALSDFDYYGETVIEVADCDELFGNTTVTTEAEGESAEMPFSAVCDIMPDVALMLQEEFDAQIEQAIKDLY